MRQGGCFSMLALGRGGAPEALANANGDASSMSGLISKLWSLGVRYNHE